MIVDRGVHWHRKYWSHVAITVSGWPGIVSHLWSRVFHTRLERVAELVLYRSSPAASHAEATLSLRHSRGFSDVAIEPLYLSVSLAAEVLLSQKVEGYYTTKDDDCGYDASDGS